MERTIITKPSLSMVAVLSFTPNSYGVLALPVLSPEGQLGDAGLAVNQRYGQGSGCPGDRAALSSRA